MSKGQIIFLNGASSSGKSSIAKALQEVMEKPCVHLCIDDYLGTFQTGLWDNKEVVQREWPNIIAGFHAAAAAIARAGTFVIVDDVLEEEPPWIEKMLVSFDGLDVTFVGVYCPLAELERREKERGDRRQGMARQQFEQVHAQAIYDVEVDTSVLCSAECASIIVDCMDAKQRPSAFERLRERFLRTHPTLKGENL
jgi:chloramphenicol 3-O phosphotransferase